MRTAGAQRFPERERRRLGSFSTNKMLTRSAARRAEAAANSSRLGMSRGRLIRRIRNARVRIAKAEQQIVLLNNRLRDLNSRLRRAGERDQLTYCINLSRRLNVVEGVKHMYDIYMCNQRHEIVQLIVSSVNSDDEEESASATDDGNSE